MTVNKKCMNLTLFSLQKVISRKVILRSVGGHPRSRIVVYEPETSAAVHQEDDEDES